MVPGRKATVQSRPRYRKRAPGNPRRSAASLWAKASIAIALAGFTSLAHGQGCVPSTATYPCVYVVGTSNVDQGMFGPYFGIVVLSGVTNTIFGSPIIPDAGAGYLQGVGGIAVTPDNQFVLFTAFNSNQYGLTPYLEELSTTAPSPTFVSVLQGVGLQIAVSPDNKQAWIAESPAGYINKLGRRLASCDRLGRIPYSYTYL